VLISACGSGRQAAWDTTPDPVSTPASDQARSEVGEITAQAEAAWAERIDEAQLRAAIAKWKQAAEIDSSNYDIWVRISRAHYFLADGHLSFDEARTPEMLESYEMGMEAAERALIALSSDFAQRMRAGTRIEEAVSVLDARSVPALYWRSANMGKWALAKGFATLLSRKDEVRAIMARCLELDATYWHSGPNRYFGAFYAKVPAFAGGDLTRSRRHFEAALRAAPNYLGTRMLYAQLYAVKAQDRALFEEQLNLILEADVSQNPDIAAENTVEQRRARELMTQADEFFE